MLKKIVLGVVSCVLITAAGVASAGNTRTFWTEAPSANLTTSINVLNFDETTTVTVTATFYDVTGNALGNTTKALAPNARWNFATNALGNSTLAFYLWSAGSGSIRINSDESTQNFGAYGTVYKTTTISGFNFTLPSGTIDSGGDAGTTYTLSTDTVASVADLSQKGVAPSSITHSDYQAGSHTTATCYSCHVINFIQSPAHSSSNTSCDSCHTTTTFTGTEYTHATMTFNGAHATIQGNCTSCHSATSSALNWSGVTLESECSTCHASDFSPSAAHGSNTNCTDCHTNTAWTGATVSHTTMTFSGAHSSIETTCTKCHASDSTALLWSGVTLETECDTCHISDFIANAAHSSTNTLCSNCHTTTAFTGASYTHATMTFTGAHAAIEPTCSKCHETGSSTLLWPGVTKESQCISCHSAKPGPLGFNIIDVPEVRKAEKTSPHGGGMVGPGKPDPSTKTGFYASSNDVCAYCHNFLGSTSFDHIAFKTGLRCNKCHYSNAAWTAGTRLSSSDYHGDLVGTCENCHTTSVPSNHAATSGCSTCHRYAAAVWSVEYGAHASMTFTGSHANIKNSCSNCHVAGGSELQWSGVTTESQCSTCHAGDFNLSNVNHSSSFTDCTQCHSTSGWTGATAHTTMTFSGAHATALLTCTNCHVAGSSALLWTGVTLETECSTCHATDKIPHAAHLAGIDDCASCHTTTTFTGGSYGHATMTFSGAHDTIKSSCSNCHVTGSTTLNWTGVTLETQCGTCHLSNFDSTRAGHSSGSTACGDCHTTSTWAGAAFAHTGISSGCSECHLSNFDSTRSGHSSGSTTCEDCHNTTNWADATFDHTGTTSGCDGCHSKTHRRDYSAGECEWCHSQGISWAYSHTLAAGMSNKACPVCHTNWYGEDRRHQQADAVNRCQECHTDRDLDA